MELIWITEAKYIEGYKVKLKFNNDALGTVDLESHLKGPIFQPLKDWFSPLLIRQFFT